MKYESVGKKITIQGASSLTAIYRIRNFRWEVEEEEEEKKEVKAVNRGSEELGRKVKI